MSMRSKSFRKEIPMKNDDVYQSLSRDSEGAVFFFGVVNAFSSAVALLLVLLVLLLLLLPGLFCSTSA